MARTAYSLAQRWLLQPQPLLPLPLPPPAQAASPLPPLALELERRWLARPKRDEAAAGGACTIGREPPTLTSASPYSTTYAAAATAAPQFAPIGPSAAQLQHSQQQQQQQLPRHPSGMFTAASSAIATQARPATCACAVGMGSSTRF